MPIDPGNPGPYGGQPAFKGIAGEKYGNDPDKVVEGYNNLYNLSLDTYRENERLKAMLAEREETPGIPDPRMDPSARVSARETLEQVGVPTDALEGVVRETVEKYLTPVLEGAKARQYVASTYPEFEKIENDLAQFIQSNSELKADYSRAYAANPKVAMEWAYQQYMKNKSNPASASGADQAAARMDALLHPNGGGDRTVTTQTAQDAQMTEAWNYWMRTGDVTPYMRLKAKMVIPEGHLDGSYWSGRT